MQTKNSLIFSKYYLVHLILLLLLVLALAKSSFALTSHNAYPSTAQGKGIANCAITVWESEIVKPQLLASDPDYKKGYGPAGKIVWTYKEPLSSNGIWQTKIGDAGIYQTSVKVSDGEYEDNINFCIEILKPNQPPIPQIAYYEIYQGESVQISPTVIDSDSTKVQIIFQSPISLAGMFIGEKAGYYQIPYTVNDGQYERSSIIKITVWSRTNSINSNQQKNPISVPLPDYKPNNNNNNPLIISSECKTLIGKPKPAIPIVENKSIQKNIGLLNCDCQTNGATIICDKNKVVNINNKLLTVTMPNPILNNNIVSENYPKKIVYLNNVANNQKLGIKPGCSCTFCD